MKQTLKDGQYFRATISKVECVGMVAQSSGGSVYLLQEEQDGAEAPDRRGFKYSWTVSDGSPQNLKNNEVSGLTIITKREFDASYLKKYGRRFNPVLGLPTIVGYKVKVEGKNLVFGCGAVTVPTKNLPIIIEFLKGFKNNRVIEGMFATIQSQGIGLHQLVKEVPNLVKIQKKLAKKR